MKLLIEGAVRVPIEHAVPHRSDRDLPYLLPVSDSGICLITSSYHHVRDAVDDDIVIVMVDRRCGWFTLYRWLMIGGAEC